MKNKFTFRPVATSDISLICQWFNLPHVMKFYSLRNWTESEVLEKLKPYLSGEKPVSGFIVLMNEKPIGYIQKYKVSDYPWPNQHLDHAIITNAAGMDVFIGDENLLGKGIGRQIIQEFLETHIWPLFQYCIVDPDTRNISAINCYEKLNFHALGDIDTKDALNQPVTLELMMLRRNEIIQWAFNYLVSHRYKLNSYLPENIQNTPWSDVIRFSTTDGYIYLKHTPELIALEANIIQILQDQFHASVPEVIADNAALNCFLMKDAGVSLRSILKKQFDVDLVCKAVGQFTSLQLTVADYHEIFFDKGVPDWRLDKLPDLFRNLLLQDEWLMADGLSEMEINELTMMLPAITVLCNKVSAYAIKQTIVQPDFNDNNTLISDDSHKITIIDLGEIAISHPFFSLLNWLYQMKKHYGLTEKDGVYQSIRDACLQNFLMYESRENLLNILELIRPLWFVYGAVAGYRLMEACGQERIMSYQREKLAGTLRELISTHGNHQS